MISHLKSIGYKPTVGDSFTGDTPLFIKYNDTGFIDIKPISELINEEYINKDILGREYDYSKKDYSFIKDKKMQKYVKNSYLCQYS